MVLNIKRVSSTDEMEHNERIRKVQLAPFENQVGGNTPFFSLPNGHLLKPCSERELLFYRSMPTELLPLTPRCCSTIYGSSSSSMPQCCSTCSKEMEENVENVVLPPKTCSPRAELTKRKLSRNFIVLSDLTRDFEHPCVLDLKIGTRQHGDEAPPEKAVTQSMKCAATTSASLGIRLCGMRYFSESGDEIYVDKYEGRRMSDENLRSALRQFFQSTDACDSVLQQVTKTKEVLSTLNGVRLFGSSLLVVVEEKGLTPRAVVRLVDFANATLPNFLHDNLYEGPDDGSLKGLTTLEQILGTL